MVWHKIPINPGFFVIVGCNSLQRHNITLYLQLLGLLLQTLNGDICPGPHWGTSVPRLFHLPLYRCHCLLDESMYVRVGGHEYDARLSRRCPNRRARKVSVMKLNKPCTVCWWKRLTCSAILTSRVRCISRRQCGLYRLSEATDNYVKSENWPSVEESII